METNAESNLHKSAEIVAGLASQASLVLDSHDVKQSPTATTFDKATPDYLRVISFVNPIDHQIRRLNERLLEKTRADGTQEFEMQTPTRVTTAKGTFHGYILDSWTKGDTKVTSQECALDLDGRTVELKESVVVEDETGLKKVRDRLDANFEPVSDSHKKFIKQARERVRRRERRHRLLGRIGLGKFVQG